MGAAAKLLFPGPAWVYVMLSRRRVSRSSGSGSLHRIRAISEMAHSRALRLRRHRDRGGPAAMGGAFARLSCLDLVRGRVSHRAGRRPSARPSVPILFFWQASEEAEDIGVNAERNNRSSAHPNKPPSTVSAASDSIHTRDGAFQYRGILHHPHCRCTLHAHGITDIDTADQAAKALEPSAGRFAFLLFAAGNYRHRPAGRSGSRRFRRVRRQRGLRLDSQPGKKADARAATFTRRSP